MWPSHYPGMSFLMLELCQRLLVMVDTGYSSQMNILQEDFRNKSVFFFLSLIWWLSWFKWRSTGATEMSGFGSLVGNVCFQNIEFIFISNFCGGFSFFFESCLRETKMFKKCCYEWVTWKNISFEMYTFVFWSLYVCMNQL